jgi:hypothetical protein
MDLVFRSNLFWVNKRTTSLPAGRQALRMSGFQRLRGKNVSNSLKSDDPTS